MAGASLFWHNFVFLIAAVDHPKPSARLGRSWRKR